MPIRRRCLDLLAKDWIAATTGHRRRAHLQRRHDTAQPHPRQLSRPEPTTGARGRGGACRHRPARQTAAPIGVQNMGRRHARPSPGPRRTLDGSRVRSPAPSPGAHGHGPRISVRATRHYVGFRRHRDLLVSGQRARQDITPRRAIDSAHAERRGLEPHGLVVATAIVRATRASRRKCWGRTRSESRDYPRVCGRHGAGVSGRVWPGYSASFPDGVSATAQRAVQPWHASRVGPTRCERCRGRWRRALRLRRRVGRRCKRSSSIGWLTRWAITRPSARSCSARSNDALHCSCDPQPSRAQRRDAGGRAG